MSKYSSNFEFSSDMTKKLIFGHLASLGPHKRRPSGHWVLYWSPLKGLGSFSTLTPIEKFRRGPKSNFWPLWDTPIPGGQKNFFFLLKKWQRSNKKKSYTLHKFFFSHGVRIWTARIVFLVDFRKHFLRKKDFFGHLLYHSS